MLIIICRFIYFQIFAPLLSLDCVQNYFIINNFKNQYNQNILHKKTEQKVLLLFMLLDELFYIHFLMIHLGIAYIFELIIYLNVQALFELILGQLRFVINV